MKWLRSRPADVNELDECAMWAQHQAKLMQDIESLDPRRESEDSEMVDDHEGIDAGEADDQEMDSGRRPVQEVTHSIEESGTC